MRKKAQLINELLSIEFNVINYNSCEYIEEFTLKKENKTIIQNNKKKI